MPFDFDGHRLLWLKYCDKDNREIYTFTFDEAKAKCVLALGVNEGMISHVKFLKKKNTVGTKIFYVKDTSEIIMFDMVTETKTKIG